MEVKPLELLNAEQLFSAFKSSNGFDFNLFLRVAEMVSGKISYFLAHYQEDLLNLPPEDHDHLRIQIHGLKSNLAHVGATKLSQNFKTLETLLVGGDYNEFCYQLKKVLPELVFFHEEFETARSRGFPDVKRHFKIS